MTIEHNNEEIMIIKCKIMNVFKRINEKIDDIKKSSRHDNVKLKKIFKSIFDFRSRNLNSQFIFINIITLNFVDNLITNFVHLISLITFSSIKNKTLIKNSVIKGVKSKTSLKLKCFKNDEFFD